MKKRWIVLGVLAVVVAVLGVVLWQRGGGNRKHDETGRGNGAPNGRGSAGGPAATPGGIDGVVLDDHGAPVAGAVVRAAPASRLADADGARTATAGADGRFAIDVVAGRWALTASAAGHAPGEAAVDVPPGERVPAELRLAPGGATVRGTVVDATGGNVAGALIVLAPEAGVLSADMTRAAATTSDADGHFAVGVVPGRWRVTTTHPEYVADERAIDVAAGGAELDISLTPGGVVEGTVRDLASRAPVGGARVSYAREVVTQGFMGGGAGERERGEVTAAADGTFRISGLGAGRIVLRAEADDDRASTEPAEVLLGVAETATDVDVFLAPVLSIRGRVAYDDGTPAAGARVTSFARGEGGATTAADDGTFHLIGVRAGDYVLRAEAEDAPPGGELRVTVADAPLTDVALTITRGAYITGRVEPAGLAEVTVVHPDDDAAIMPKPFMMADIGGGPAARTAADGTFRIGPFAPGHVTLAAKAPDGRRGRAEVDVTAKGADGVVITLEQKLHIAGRVVSKGGKPVPGAVVTLRRAAEGASRTTIVNGVDVGADRAPTGPDGTFAIAGLEAGTYELSVLDGRGGPYAFDRKEPDSPEKVVLPEGQSKDGVELVVEAEDGVIRGVVLGPDGAPAPDTWVSAAPEQAWVPGVGRMGKLEDGAPPAEHHEPEDHGDGPRSVMITVMNDGNAMAGEIPPVLTDDAGRFTIAGLRHGAYRLSAEGLKGAARGALAGVETGADVTVKMQTLSKLRGTVTMNGAPVTDFTVAVEGPTRKDRQVHDAGGAFSLTALDPGDYQVTARSPAGEGRATATIIAGQETQVAIAIVGDGRVVGTLLDEQGAPLAGRMVALGDRMSAGEMRIELSGEPPMTGADGKFSVASPAGPRTMFILGENGPELRKDVDVVAGQTVDLGTLNPDPHSLH